MQANPPMRVCLSAEMRKAARARTTPTQLARNGTIQSVAYAMMRRARRPQGDAVQRAITMGKMMEVWRHKSADTLRGYVRRAALFREHAGAAFL